MSAEERSRLATRLAVVWFLLATATLVWPIYPAYFDRIEPRVLGLPFSLIWVLIVIVANFAALVLLYALRLVDDREHEELEEQAR
ncbi:MAG: hypothetical protein HC927_03740 [Deltaproteobacteria bacterium]|nr:hypothetical protein [Deltaproteobacteria bacterium]